MLDHRRLARRDGPPTPGVHLSGGSGRLRRPPRVARRVVGRVRVSSKRASSSGGRRRRRARRRGDVAARRVSRSDARRRFGALAKHKLGDPRGVPEPGVRGRGRARRREREAATAERRDFFRVSVARASRRRALHREQPRPRTVRGVRVSAFGRRRPRRTQRRAHVHRAEAGETEQSFVPRRRGKNRPAVPRVARGCRKRLRGRREQRRAGVYTRRVSRARERRLKWRRRRRRARRERTRVAFDRRFVSCFGDYKPRRVDRRRVRVSRNRRRVVLAIENRRRRFRFEANAATAGRARWIVQLDRCRRGVGSCARDRARVFVVLIQPRRRARRPGRRRRLSEPAFARRVTEPARRRRRHERRAGIARRQLWAMRRGVLEVRGHAHVLRERVQDVCAAFPRRRIEPGTQSFRGRRDSARARHDCSRMVPLRSHARDGARRDA